MSNGILIILGILVLITMAAVTYAYIGITDEETRNKKWFKIYVIYMKTMIVIGILILVEGVFGLKYWYK